MNKCKRQQSISWGVDLAREIKLPQSRDVLLEVLWTRRSHPVGKRWKRGMAEYKGPEAGKSVVYYSDTDESGVFGAE